MKGILRAIDTIIKYILVLLMAVISFLGIFQVVMRTLGVVPAWTEESIRFLFIWSICIAAAIGIKEKIHIGIDVFVNLLPKLGRQIVEVVVQLVLIVFDVFIIIYGFNLVAKTAAQPSPALRLPMSYVYLAIPVLGILGAFYSIQEVVRIILKRREPNNA